MIQFLIRRLLWTILVLFSVSVITFVLMRAVPGGPFNTDKGVPESVQRNLEEKYRLNDPIVVQYLDYMSGLLIPRITDEDYQRSTTSDYIINIPNTDSGVALRWMNFGPSLVNRSRTVSGIMRDSLPVSFTLGAAALLIAMVIGFPTGIMSALRRNTWVDYVGMGIATFGISIPALVLGPVLVYVFAVGLDWFPANGWGDLNQIVLPAFALGFAESALVARLTRASLLQVLNQDFIRTARAKGLAGNRIIGLHAMKNALIPVITVLGPLAAALLTGTFVVEIIFGIPGLGKFFVSSISNRDYTVIMGTVMLYAFFLVIANFIVDLMYAWIDPRIRY